MNLHEFQAKEILRRHGIPVPPGHAAENPDQAAEAFRRLGAPAAVVKAQIHAGGRGRGIVYESDLRTVRRRGGVAAVRSPQEAAEAARAMLGHPLVTRQTGPRGRVVRRVYVEAAADVYRELYAGVALDRRAGRPVLMASARGGMEVEDAAASDPGAVLREYVDPAEGLRTFQARRLGSGLGLSGGTLWGFARLAVLMARAYLERDCTLLEINPLGIDRAGGLLALDARMSVDDRAIGLRRQPEIEAMRDDAEEDPLERQAEIAGVSYVSMDGDIGCMVNGAGLAMATMDALMLAGGRPANFLDVGGGAGQDQVVRAFRLLVSNPSVKAVFVNIFGGILRCDLVARGIVEAARHAEFSLPLIVRLEGAAAAEGRRILGESRLGVMAASDLADGARKAVEAAGARP